jgi:serine/threonine protein kinase
MLERISHYRLLQRLGAGGMGEVYLGEDTQLGRKVAIKILPTESGGDEQAGIRLIREARAAATLDHHNICAVYEVGEDDGRTFIAMQYIQGETLAARITRGPLELKEALAAAVQVAEALQEAHAHGIVHRDIKPQNIMVNPRGQIKVLDFGLAKRVREQTDIDSEAATVSQVTASGTIVGTVLYMSPEQVKGDELDSRSDIFQFWNSTLRASHRASPVCGRERGRDPIGNPDARARTPAALRDRCIRGAPTDRTQVLA